MKEILGNVGRTFCISASIFSGLVMTGGIAGLALPSIFVLSGIGAVAASPFVYVGLDRLSKNIDKKQVNYLSFLIQSLEKTTDDKAYNFIHANTVDFKYYIDKALNGNSNSIDLMVDSDTKNNINQLLYLINSNYYVQVKENFPNLSREDLIERVLWNLVSYLKENNKIVFSHKEVKRFLDRCSFFDDNMKKAVVKEYKNGKFKFKGKIIYTVCPDNNKNKYNNIGKEVVGEDSDFFDLDNEFSYRIVIDRVAKSDHCKRYGVASKLIWDIDSLKTMMQIIFNDFGDKLQKDKDKIIDLDLITSFVISTTIYSLANKKEKVGIEEMVNTFKTWDYMPYSLKLEALNCVVEKMNLTDVKHPYVYKSKIKSNSN